MNVIPNNSELAIIKDKQTLLPVVKESGKMLLYASDELKDDKDVVLAAVSQKGNSLQYASDRLKKDNDVVAAAIKSDPEALKYASMDLRIYYRKIQLFGDYENGLPLILPPFPKDFKQELSSREPWQNSPSAPAELINMLPDKIRDYDISNADKHNLLGNFELSLGDKSNGVTVYLKEAPTGELLFVLNVLDYDEQADDVFEYQKPLQFNDITFIDENVKNKQIAFSVDFNNKKPDEDVVDQFLLGVMNEDLTVDFTDPGDNPYSLESLDLGDTRDLLSPQDDDGTNEVKSRITGISM